MIFRKDLVIFSVYYCHRSNQLIQVVHNIGRYEYTYYTEHESCTSIDSPDQIGLVYIGEF